MSLQQLEQRTIFRMDKKEGDFTQIHNTLLTDPNLQKDNLLGILLNLLSKPDNWRVIPGVVAKECNMNIQTARKKLSKLEKLGYLSVIKQSKNEKGHFTPKLYIVNESPVIPKPSTVVPLTVVPSTERVSHNNTNISNTNLNKTKINIYANEISKKETVKESDKNPKTLSVKSESKKIALNQKANLPVQETASFTEQKERKESLLKVLKDPKEFPVSLIDNPEYWVNKLGVSAFNKQLELTKYDKETARFPGTFINRVKSNSDVKPENYVFEELRKRREGLHDKYAAFLDKFQRISKDNRIILCSPESIEEVMTVFTFKIISSVGKIKAYRAEKYLENKEKMLLGYEYSQAFLNMALNLNFELTREICLTVLKNYESFKIYFTSNPVIRTSIDTSALPRIIAAMDCLRNYADDGADSNG